LHVIKIGNYILDKQYHILVVTHPSRVQIPDRIEILEKKFDELSVELKKESIFNHKVELNVQIKKLDS